MSCQGVSPGSGWEEPMADDDRLDLEFAYTSFQDSCRDLHSLVYRCRRPIGHDGVHAAGFGQQRIRWHQPTDHHLDAPVPTH